jgi:hypothetical protein
MIKLSIYAADPQAGEPRTRSRRQHFERIRRPAGARFEVDDELSEIREIKERISIATAVGKA